MNSRLLILVAALVFQSAAWGQPPQDDYFGDVFGPAGAPDDEPMPMAFEAPTGPITALDAARKVYGARYTVDRIVQWCATNVPASAKAVGSAKRQWTREPAEMVRRADEVIKGSLNQQELGWLVQLNKSLNDPGEERLARQDVKEQTRWCQQSAPTRIRDGNLRLAEQADLLTALSVASPK